MTSRRLAWWSIGLMAFALVFGACTATQPRFAITAGAEPLPGFWRGFWHGFIAPVAFFVSLVSNEVRVYAFPNTGHWYEFGFMLGISGFSGGVFAGSRRRTIVVRDQ